MAGVLVVTSVRTMTRVFMVHVCVRAVIIV
jgi:hypothetical protein